MWNKVLLSSVLLACLTSAAHAGEMGPVESYTFKPFIIGEAAYSWPQLSTVNMHTSYGLVTSDNQVQGWGGRVATGLMRQISEKFALSFEGGLIYNDHISMLPVLKVPGASVMLDSSRFFIANFDQYGFDILGGINYVRPKYDLFFKAGVLLENLRSKFALSAHDLLYGNTRQANIVKGTHQGVSINVGQAMPEVKLGGAYHVNENWSLTASWMHAFGGELTFAASAFNLTTGSVSIGDLGLALNNPTIDSVLFGVQYNFG